MRELRIIQQALPFAVANSFAHHNHRGQRQPVVFHESRQVLQLSSEDFLVGPRQAVAGSHRRIGRIAPRKQLVLHLLRQGGREEDAERSPMTSQCLQALPFGHGRPSLATRQDDGLRPSGHRQLASQSRCGSQEAADARGDAIVHAMLVEERHLLVDGSIDTRVARVKAHHLTALVVKLLHQLKLLPQRHACTTPHHCPRLGAGRKRTGHQAAGIEYEVGLLKEPPSAHAHQLRVARTCPHNLDVTMLGRFLRGYSKRVVASAEAAFLLFHAKRTLQSSCSLSHARAAHLGQHAFAGMRNGHVGQLFRCINGQCCPRQLPAKLMDERLVLFQHDCSHHPDGLRRIA